MNQTNVDELVEEIFNLSSADCPKEEKSKEISEIKGLVEPLVNLIEEAKEKKKYIYIKVSSTWMSPDDFELKLKDGYYVYHTNFLELRDPMQRLEELEEELFDKRMEIVKFIKEMSSYIGVDEKEIELTVVKKIMIKEKDRESEK